MIAAISPAGINYDETLSTLRFAQSVSAISTKAAANVDEEASVIDRMRKEIETLKKLIEAKKKENAEGLNDDEIQELKECMKQQMKQIESNDEEEQVMKKQLELR